MAFDPAPLPHEWMVASIIGFFVSWLLVYQDISQKWGAAFMALAVIIFLASVVSMTNAGTDEHHLRELAIHERRHQ